MVLIKFRRKEDEYGNKTIRNISRRKTKATNCQNGSSNFNFEEVKK
jgi:hypothetical protein